MPKEWVKNCLSIIAAEAMGSFSLVAAAYFQRSIQDSETHVSAEVRGEEASSSHTEIPRFAVQTL